MRSSNLTGYVTYKELTALFGKRLAYVALTLLERSAVVQVGDVIDLDCEKRLGHAFDAMRDKSRSV